MDSNCVDVERKTTTENAKKYISSVNVSVDKEVPYKVSIMITENTTDNNIIIKTPIHYQMSEDSLTAVYEKLMLLGLPGRQILKAFVDAVDEIDNDYIKNVCTNTSKCNPVRYFIDWCKMTIELRTGSPKLSRSGCWKLLFQYKGYKGLKKTFKRLIRETSDEVNRIKHLEKSFNKITDK